MDNAKILFNKITLDYIKAEMLGKQFENNWLECKRKERPENGSVDIGDKARFAKCLSGFANTGGGVVIFGLDARKENGVDAIIGLVPINDLRQFESSLRELESRIVERNIVGVEYASIETEPGKGLLVVYIPQSPSLPHRSLADHNFYIRAGGTFQPLDLPLIEDLFQRRLRPKLSFVAKHLGDRQIWIYLRNTGEGTAKNPYLVFNLPEGLGLSLWELDGNTRQASCVLMSSFKDFNGHFVAFKDGAVMPIHPQAEVPIARLDATGRVGGVTFPL